MQAMVIDRDEFAQMVSAARRRQLSVATPEGRATVARRHLASPASPAFAEAFRLLALSVMGLGTTRPVKTIMVMGAYPGDGRTTTVANLGIALAELGSRVLAVEADARAPGLASLLGVGAQPRPLARSALSVVSTSFEGLLLVRPAWGNAAVDPPTAEQAALPLLKRAQQMVSARGRRQERQESEPVLPALRTIEAFIQDTCQQKSREEPLADFVILDSPPCLRYSDAFLLAPQVDGVLYVVRRRRQDVEAQQGIQARLRALGANVVGAVYNEA